MNPGQPYTTGQILEAFKNSGMPLNPKNSVQILYTALKRSPKFERVGNKAWGLREWYPEKKKRTSSDHNLPDIDSLPDHNPIMDAEDDSKKITARKMAT
jgi:DNA-directed RNA polymerase delta subunit